MKEPWFWPSEGHKLYLEAVLKGLVGGHHGGPAIARPRMRKRTHQHPTIGSPSYKGSYTIVHKGTKEW